MARQFYWRIDGRIIGEPFVPPQPFSVARFEPFAKHYLCPECGTLWAQLLPLDGGATRHQPYTVPCPRCGVGSLVRNYEDIMSAPYAILRREMTLTGHPDYGNIGR